MNVSLLAQSRSAPPTPRAPIEVILRWVPAALPHKGGGDFLTTYRFAFAATGSFGSSLIALASIVAASGSFL